MKKIRLILPRIVPLREILGLGWGVLFSACMFAFAPSGFGADRTPAGIDQELRAVLGSQGFTGKVEPYPAWDHSWGTGQ